MHTALGEVIVAWLSKKLSRMNFLQISLPIALALNLALGIIVFWTNSKRTANQVFFTLSVSFTIWLTCLKLALTAQSAQKAELWIRQSSAAAIFIPTIFNALRHSLNFRNESWFRIFGRSKYWLFQNALVIFLCQTHFFLYGAQLPSSGIPEPAYGPGFLIYISLCVSAFFLSVFRFVKDLRAAEGIHRTELQFILLGCAMCSLVGVTTALIIPLLTHNSWSVQLAPFCAVVLDAIIAYGIARRRIMDIAEVLRRIVAYTLLTTYLSLLYTAVWVAMHAILLHFPAYASPLAYLFAALAVAFSMSPAQGRFQEFAKRLYLITPPIDTVAIARRADRVLHSITTLSDLLTKFSSTIAESLGSDYVSIIFLEKNLFALKHSQTSSQLTESSLPINDPIVRHLDTMHEPLVMDALERLRRTPEIEAIQFRMEQLKAAIAVGIRLRGTLQAVMLLGPRLSGQVYGIVEQNILQVLCNQLAIAIENAQLYTSAQDSKIYNELLLENLVSGVIAANTHGIITVFNREAQHVTRLAAADVLNKPVDMLPGPLSELFKETLRGGESLREVETILHHGNNDFTPIRMGSSIFKGHSGAVLGVLVVFKDMTAVKKLEHQVRRTDRLASMGTLSAGMAHEIKNPLVAIKTFAQLLPERYQDNEFRESFSSVVGQEIDRIDGIVNQLLSFARPAKPALTPMDLHKMLDKSLRLIQHQVEQQGIELHREFCVTPAMIQADSHLLQQAFLNLLLNAIEAMNRGGHLSVLTSVSVGDSNGHGRPIENVTVRIKDSGHGIKPEDLAHVFDPFFTTKSTGTGLGLSVAHQIIQEHGGEVEVESELSKGTSFQVTFPLLQEQTVAA